MAANSYGDGSIFWDSERGKWRWQGTIDNRRVIRRADTKTELRDKVNRAKRDAARGVLSRDQQITVADIVTRYVERTLPNRRRGQLAPSTRYLYEWAAGHLIDELGKTRASKLTRRTVEDALDRLAPHLGKSSLKKILGLLRSALDDAVADRVIAQNVARTAQLPAEHKAGATKRSLSPATASRLLNVLEDEPNGALFAVMLLLGLRPGEAAGLQWDAIQGSVLTVSRAVQLDHGRPTVTDTLKNRSSYRTLDMPNDLVARLERHRKRQAEARLASTTWTYPQLVFATARGGCLSPSNVRKQLAELCERHGIYVDDNGTERTPRPHELRHSTASLLSDRAVPLEQIADLLGHSSIRQLEDTYRHRIRPSVSIARDHDWRTA